MVGPNCEQKKLIFNYLVPSYSLIYAVDLTYAVDLRGGFNLRDANPCSDT